MSNDARVRAFRDKRFCLRPAAAPDLPRASGDSGFVAHLAATYAIPGGLLFGTDWAASGHPRDRTYRDDEDGKIATMLDEDDDEDFDDDDDDDFDDDDDDDEDD